MFTVYRITRNDGLEYIGQTTNLSARAYNHSRSSKFKNIGIKSIETLAFTDSKERADQLETFYITEYDTFNNGLNMTSHGGGNHTYKGKFSTFGLRHSDKTKQKIAEKSRKRMNKYHKLGIGAASSKARERSRINMTITRRKQGCTHTKFNERQIREVLELYKRRPNIDGIGTTLPNGHVKTYDRAFANMFAKNFSMTPNHIRNLIQGKSKHWNRLYSEILGSRS